MTGFPRYRASAIPRPNPSARCSETKQSQSRLETVSANQSNVLCPETPLWCLAIATPGQPGQSVGGSNTNLPGSSFGGSGSGITWRGQSYVPATHASVLKEQLAQLELKRSTSNISSDSSPSSVLGLKNPRGSLKMGPFAFYRKGDVNSMHLQIEHLKLELSKKDTELDMIKTDKINNDIKMLKVTYN